MWGGSTEDHQIPEHPEHSEKLRRETIALKSEQLTG